MPVYDSDIPHVGRVHRVTGTLTRDDEAQLKSEGCRRLLLNEMDQVSRNGLAFLERLPELEQLHLSDLLVEDVSGIHHLRNLRVLNLNSYDNTSIDFRCFPRLEDCFTFWRPGIQSLFEVASLKRLQIQRYQNDDLTALGALARLTSLTLVDPRITTLRGVEALPAMTSLEIVGARRLEDAGVVVLAAATRLEELELSQCRLLTHIGPVGELPHLRRVALHDCKRLETVQPLRRCAALEEVGLGGSTNLVDGDLTFLLELPRLKTVRIAKRKHYQPQPEELLRMLAARGVEPT